MSEKITERFNELLEQMKNDDNGKFDFTARLHDFELNDATGHFVLNDEDYSLTPQAYGQLMSRIGIPAQYARRTPPALLKPHFDYWKKEAEDSDIFVRAKSIGANQRIRAILSPSYNVLDNKQVIEVFQQFMPKDRYRVVDYNITDDFFNARLIFTHIDYNHAVDPNGRTNHYFAGLNIANGETGNSTVMIDLIIWEQWCSNGAIRRASDNSPILYRKHLGKKNNLLDLFTTNLDGIDLAAEEAMEQFAATRLVVIDNPITTLKEIMNRRKELFPESLQKTVIECYEDRPDSTKYGILSAFTRAAHELTGDRRIAVETVAGNLMRPEVRLH